MGQQPFGDWPSYGDYGRFRACATFVICVPLSPLELHSPSRDHMEFLCDLGAATAGRIMNPIIPA